MTDNNSIHESGGNVFDDLGLPDSDVRLAKAELARAIRRLLQARDFTQAQSATLLGVAQPDISDLFRGRLDRFSMDRLERFLNKLDMDVRIQVAPRAPASARAGLSVECTRVTNAAVTDGFVMYMPASTVTLSLSGEAIGNFTQTKPDLQLGSSGLSGLSFFTSLAELVTGAMIDLTSISTSPVSYAGTITYPRIKGSGKIDCDAREKVERAA